jgi:hypothetical protein
MFEECERMRFLVPPGLAKAGVGSGEWGVGR